MTVTLARVQVIEPYTKFHHEIVIEWVKGRNGGYYRLNVISIEEPFDAKLQYSRDYYSLSSALAAASRIVKREYNS